MVKNLPVSAGHTRDMGLPLGQEDLLEKEMATHSSISCLENGCKKLDTIENAHATDNYVF